LKSANAWKFGARLSLGKTGAACVLRIGLWWALDEHDVAVPILMRLRKNKTPGGKGE